MRTIEFRAWNKKFNKMEFSVVPAPDGSGDVWGYDEEAKEFEHWVGNKESFVIMQFTGLKDKNGKEIYEGDILERVGNRPVPFVVSIPRIYFPTLEIGDYEIIGNIYEHKELLNGK